MPELDSTAIAAVESSGFARAEFLLLDLADEPLRFTTFGQDTVISGSGDSELDGTYPAFGGQLINIGDVSNSDSGSDTLTVSLSGIQSIDTELLADIGDRTKWQGRLCRIWFRLYDESGVTPQGAIVPLYTGYMSSVRLISEPEQQIIELSVENWLAAFNQPSNRSYLNQSDYDSNDTSAQATLAASNGTRRDTGAAPGSSSALITPSNIPPGTYNPPNDPFNAAGFDGAFDSNQFISKKTPY